MKSFASPDAFVAAAGIWQRPLVERLRAAIHAGGAFAEGMKWGNLVFSSGGLCMLIHVEDRRVLLGFWRGKRLRDLEPRIRASGKYELGNIILREEEEIADAQVARLAAAAAALNAQLGDPTVIARQQTETD
jgi:hypothetical protein